jgi:hypothetical protein
VKRRLVLENDVIWSVNANRTHDEAGAAAPARVDHTWLSRPFTRRVLLHDWRGALIRRRHDVNVALGFGAGS